MATTRKKPAPVEAPKQLELPEVETIRVIFDGQGNKTVCCCINGEGFTYPADTEVETTKAIAEVIGRFTVV